MTSPEAVATCVAALRHATTTAANDDETERMTEKRRRHTDRIAAMLDGADMLEALAADRDKWQRLDAEAATHVESVICMRTGFTAEPPYVGWKGLGLALSEALDDRDRLGKERDEARELAQDRLDGQRQVTASLRQDLRDCRMRKDSWIAERNTLSARNAELKRSRDYQKDRAVKANASQKAMGEGLRVAKEQLSAALARAEKAEAEVRTHLGRT